MPQIKNSWFVALLICILFPTQYCILVGQLTNISLDIIQY